ncbi:MAG: hypothetical protein KBA55_13790 [Ruminococcus sp.]|nr:hypothetical protein [Ruminococcus sp.]
MKTYDETIDTIFSKGDALIEQRRERSAMIKHTSYAVSGLCAAAIVGVGIWRITDHGKMPDNSLSEIETVEDVTTNKTVATSDTNTTTISTTHSSKVATSALKPTTTGKSQTNTQSNTTMKSATSESNELTTVTATSAQTSSESDIPAATASNSQTSASEETTIMVTTTVTTTQPSGSDPPQENTTTTTSFESEIIRKLPTIFSTVALDEADSVDSKQRAQEFVYSYHNVSAGETSTLLKQITLHGEYNNADVDSNAALYEMNGCSADALIAVKFEGRDDLFLYCNRTYVPENLDEFISAFGLDDDGIIRECYRGNAKAADIAPEKAWDLLTADRSLPDVTDSCKGKYFAENDRIWITSVKESDQWLSIKIGVDPQGYIFTDTNTAIPERYFYIGEDRAAEIIGYC